LFFKKVSVLCELSLGEMESGGQEREGK